MSWGGAVALYCLLVGGCGHTKPKPPPPPPGSVSCADACAHVAALGCSTSQPLCNRLCERAAPNQWWFPGCVASATSCAAVDSCDQPPSSSPGPAPVNGR